MTILEMSPTAIPPSATSPSVDEADVIGRESDLHRVNAGLRIGGRARGRRCGRWGHRHRWGRQPIHATLHFDAGDVRLSASHSGAVIGRLLITSFGHSKARRLARRVSAAVVSGATAPLEETRGVVAAATGARAPEDEGSCFSVMLTAATLGFETESQWSTVPLNAEYGTTTDETATLSTSHRTVSRRSSRIRMQKRTRCHRFWQRSASSPATDRCLRGLGPASRLRRRRLLHPGVLSAIETIRSEG